MKRRLLACSIALVSLLVSSQAALAGEWNPATGHPVARRMRPWRPMGPAVMLLAITVAACATDLGGLPTDWMVINRTGQGLTILWERASGEVVELGDVGNGERLRVSVNEYGNPRTVCDDGELVAIGDDATEVARTPTFCSPWTIEAD